MSVHAPSRIRTVITPRPDFTYGSAEEFFYCQWVAETRPGTNAHERWYVEREAYLTAHGWVKP